MLGNAAGPDLQTICIFFGKNNSYAAKYVQLDMLFLQICPHNTLIMRGVT